MSKKLIAGAGIVASMAVALAPMATFATVADATWNSDIHTDKLNVTVLPTCAFGAAPASVTGVSHNSGSDTPGDVDTNAATWTTTGSSPIVADDMRGMTPDAASGTQHPSYHSADYNIYAGTYDANMGTTTLNVVCNQNAGYKIYVEADNLSDGETEPTSINIIQTPSASTTGYTISTSTSVSGATTAPVTSTSKTAAVTSDAPSAASGDAYTFTYSIGVAPGFKADTYSGEVEYTLVQQINS